MSSIILPFWFFKTLPKWSGLFKGTPGNPVFMRNSPLRKQFLLWLEKGCRVSSEAWNQQLSAAKAFQGAEKGMNLESYPEKGMKGSLCSPYSPLLVRKLTPTPHPTHTQRARRERRRHHYRLVSSRFNK